MLVGYVSDERYVALSDVAVEFERNGFSFEVRSLANGAVYADLPAGEYRVTLAKVGYGGKHLLLKPDAKTPYQFRLLSDGLLGYMWPKWCRSGEAAEFRVHSTSAYTLALWHYGGEKELMSRLGWFDEHGPQATVQLIPDGDFSQTGVGWNRIGYGLRWHRQRVVAPDRSGLYYLHARNEAGEFFSFPWIVAPAQPTTTVAVLASNLTWNAYNNFGGRSNYINPSRLPDEPTVNARQDLRRYTDPQYMGYETLEYLPLSLDRPEPFQAIPENARLLDPIEGRMASSMAPAEWRFLGWMEQNRFAYDYYAESQLDDGTLDLSRYRILVLVAHPEYWTRPMYDRLKRWVFEEGGRLVYLGGNGLNCEVELVGETGVVHHNGRHEDLVRTGRESRWHMRHESEASLLGVAYDDRGIMTAAPYEVIDESHWCFTGTGLRAGDRFGYHSQHKRCPGGASGHEQDKRTPSSPPGTRLLARGLNPNDGGAEMVHFTTPSGGEVFSVGSIIWPCSVLVDEPVSKITANVLRRFQER